MKAVGYIRVSTEEQATQGISLEAQKQKIEAYCVTKDLELVGIVEEGGKSAKNLNRPGFQKILSMVRSKEIEAVVIVKLDRAFRNTVDALNTTQAFDEKGVALHSISESLDTRSAMGRFFFTLTAALAEMERGLTSERTKTALAHKKAKGERYGAIPYGQTIEDGKLVPCAEEQNALSKMKRLRKQGLSFQKIADTLNATNIPTRHGRPWTRVWVDRLMRTKGLGVA